MLCAPTIKGVDRMIKKHIYYKDKTIFALYYRATNTIYYNLLFVAETKLILVK